MEATLLKFLDFGVDYYTGTCADEKRARIIQDKAALFIMQEHAAGNEKRNWGMYGYEGFHCGGVAVGTRHDGTIVRLSGPTAQAQWSKFFKLCDNVSRLDVQATMRWSLPSQTMIARHFRSAMRLHRLGRVRRKITMLRSSDSSATIYLGKRQSDRFGRIYQKDRESGLDHYQDAVRYELELKGDLAAQTARDLHSHSSPGEFSYGTVRKYYGDVGVRLPKLSDRHLALTCASRTLSDRQSRRRWLERSVKPAVQALLAYGDLPFIIEALGLSDHVVQVDQLRAQQFKMQEDLTQ